MPFSWHVWKCVLQIPRLEMIGGEYGLLCFEMSVAEPACQGITIGECTCYFASTKCEYLPCFDTAWKSAWCQPSYANKWSCYMPFSSELAQLTFRHWNCRKCGRSRPWNIRRICIWRFSILHHSKASTQRSCVTCTSHVGLMPWVRQRVWQP